MNVCKSVWVWLSNIAAVTSLLGKYPLGSGVTTPAIFTGWKNPGAEDTPYPAIRIFQASASLFGCRSKRGAEVDVDIRIFGDKTTSDADLKALALEVWKAMDRADIRDELEAEDMEPWGCQAIFPVVVADEDGFPGYLVQVHMRVLKIN